ncbi:AlpA family transcriptional regulator [Pseudomonas sp. MIL9]|uniref:helix-turn-helix transcriptional regulator n=1 Tax=Pseudomonas sp. MIL9 TaxID=2807620 RepID=UPI00194F0C73|nr:AlpA family transcriptional regulator [Pseudomonas sp. MIL9]MBM6445298.1 AlpA family transcriptional regulator [Pseudomonas sp. MIL9]
MDITPHREPIEFIRLPAVRALTGLGTTKIYDMVKKGLFPRQVPLGGRSVAWVKSEVLAWNQQKVDDARALQSQIGSSKTTTGKNTLRNE